MPLSQEKTLTAWGWVVTKLITVIILQYTRVSNCYVEHLKLIQCYLFIISQLKKKKDGENQREIT